MTTPNDPVERLRAENEELRLRLEEAEQALEAIRTGQVDSLVVDGPDGVRVFSLDSAIHSYRVLVEAMGEGAATLTESGAILYCNGRLAEMVGTPLERVMGTAMQDWVAERHRPTLRSMLQRASERDVRDELALAGADGEEVPVYVSLTAIHDDGGDVFCLVLTDLREQKTNEEIVASERLARSVLEQTADAMVVCDCEGRVTRASRAAEALCGSSALFRPFRDAFPVALAASRDGEPTRDVAEAALAGEVLRAVAGSLRRPDGTRTELLVSAAALRGADGAVLGCVIAFVDVTEHRRKEEELRRSEERYRAATESLREADRRKDEFLAVLSHELRNPLAPILNSLYILDRAAPGGDQARRAKAIIDRQIAQLTRLVDDLLDLTRISRNKIELRTAPVELNTLVRTTIEDHRSLFESSGVALEARLAPEPIPVRVDAPRIVQVIGNLLQNAAKFTRSGGSALVSVARDDARNRAVVRVTDTGIGMGAELVGRVFEPFMQAEETLERSKGGLGLGLALAKSLVEMHGGEVLARSAGPGRGAEFTVHLPIDRTPDAVAASAARTRTAQRRILVVEDRPDAAASLCEALELGGHAVAVADDGTDAIAKAREFRPDVVLCDVGLPGVSGYDVARAFRADASLRDVYLVALSGYALPDDVERAAAAGFDRHLAKPASLADLEAMLANAPVGSDRNTR